MRMSWQRRRVASMFRTLKERSLASRSIFLILSPPDRPPPPSPPCMWVSLPEAAASCSAPDTFRNFANKCRSGKHSAQGDQFLFPSPVASQREIKSQQQVIAAGGSSQSSAAARGPGLCCLPSVPPTSHPEIEQTTRLGFFTKMRPTVLSARG